MDPETQRVMEKTGLTEKEVDFYWCFYKNADWDNGVIMYGDVKFQLGTLIKPSETLSPDNRMVLIQMVYDHWLEVFRKKGLIHRIEAAYPMASYPVLIGYTPFNDPKVYVAFRKRGEERWNGRLDARLIGTEGEKLLRDGYEFK